MENKNDKKAYKLSDDELERITAGDGWSTVDGKYFYINGDGEKQTGWCDDIPGWEGKWFYFDDEGVFIKDSQFCVRWINSDDGINDK